MSADTESQGGGSLKRVVRRGVARDKSGRKRPAGWTPHVTDELDGPALRQKVIDAGLHASMCDNRPEAVAIRKRRNKLAKIMRLEAEASGEDTW